MILAAAIKLSDGSVFTGKRHGDCSNRIREQYPIKDYPRIYDGHVSGFVTHTGEFVNREDAAIIAVRYQQVIPISIDPIVWQKVFPALFSEDLY